MTRPNHADKQLTDRQRGEQRELERARESEPRRDDGPLPRIDCMRTAEKRPATVR